MYDSKDLSSTVIIYYPLYNYFVGPVPNNSDTLSLRAERNTSGTAIITMPNRG